jgi:ABC-type lipoprotein release transport system permease subunit
MIVLILGVGIGGNVAIFSVLKALLFQPLPYPEPDRLVQVWQTHIDYRTRWPFSSPDYLDVREQNRSFEEFGAYSPQRFTVGRVEPERVYGATATAGVLRAYGVEPALGRLFTEGEELEGNNRVAVLSDRFWKRRFGAEPEVVGTAIAINGGYYQVIGVMPHGFEFISPWSPGEHVAVWTPLALSRDGASRTDQWLLGIARLRPEVTLEVAAAGLRAIASGLGEQYPSTNARKQLWVNPLKRQIVGDVRGQVLLLMGAVALVLLLACANVASMLLAKSARRRTEMAIRSSLGAGRWRIVGQLLTESMVLSLLGGIAGTLIGVAGLGAMRSLIPRDVPRMADVTIDGPVLLFSLGLALLTGLIFGLAPALHGSRSEVSEVLRGVRGGHTVRGGRARMLGFLAVGQLAIALVLTNGAALLYVSFRNVIRTPQVFDAEQTLTASISLDGDRYAENQARVGFWNQLLDGVAALPGVDHTALTNQLPLLGGINDEILSEEETFESRGNGTLTEITFISPDYFDAMGIPLLAGRALRNADPASWTAAIVGVVEDVRQWGPERNPIPQVYFPHERSTWNASWLVLSSKSDPLSHVPAIKNEVARLDPGLVVSDPRRMEQVFDSTTLQRRFITRLVGLFAVVALVLAMAGVFGMMSHEVAQRTHEIGIRAALGAARTNLLAMALGRALRLASIGAVIGIVGAVLSARVTRQWVFGMSGTNPAFMAGLVIFLLIVAVAATGVPALRATNPAFMAGLVVFLLMVAVAATGVPALRATQVDPTRALRAE